MDFIEPPQVNKNAHIRVISPSRSLSFISNGNQKIAQKKLESFGFKVSYSNNAHEIDRFNSSSVETRVNDLHEAFSDPGVDIILTSIGGYNSNQIIDRLDYDLIRNNPKVLCGFSDITTLSNAILAKSGLITYSGPHFSTFAMEKGLEFTIEYFLKTLTNREEYVLTESSEWSDDPWFIDQDKRKFIPNEGHWLLSPPKKEVSGRIVGGNLNAVSLLAVAGYMPPVKGCILFLEDTAACNAETFDQRLTALLLNSKFSDIKGLLIGRFQKESKISREDLELIIKDKAQLEGIPIIANMDFGHTTPIHTIPIGGYASINHDSKVRVYSRGPI